MELGVENWKIQSSAKHRNNLPSKGERQARTLKQNKTATFPLNSCFELCPNSLEKWIFFYWKCGRLIVWIKLLLAKKVQSALSADLDSVWRPHSCCFQLKNADSNIFYSNKNITCIQIFLFLSNATTVSFNTVAWCSFFPTCTTLFSP